MRTAPPALVLAALAAAQPALTEGLSRQVIRRNQRKTLKQAQALDRAKAIKSRKQGKVTF